MGKENQDIMDTAMFFQIKEMLFCMKGYSFSDVELIKMINMNGGLNKYYNLLLKKYKNFIEHKNYKKI